MKRLARKLLIISVVLVLSLCLAVPAFATEYNMDELKEGDTLTLYPGDTIKAYEDPLDEGLYFTVLDGVGGHVGHADNKNQENIIITSFESMYGVKEQIFFGKGSLYKSGAVAGYYAYTVLVKAPATTDQITDADGNNITYTELGLTGTPLPTTYTIKYDANGGTGTIDSQEWVYAERDKSLSDGEGFTNGNYAFLGWTLDKDGAEGDAVITAEPGESLNLGPEDSLAKNIPTYATEPTRDGKAEVTLYALWDTSSAAPEDPIVPDEQQGSQTPATPSETPATPSETPAQSTTPNTGDSSMLLVSVILLGLSALCGATLYKKAKN